MANSYSAASEAADMDVTNVDLSLEPFPSARNFSLKAYRIRQAYLTKNPDSYEHYSDSEPILPKPTRDFFGADNMAVTVDMRAYSWSEEVTHITKKHQLWWPWARDPTACPCVWHDGVYAHLFPEKNHLSDRDIGGIGLYLCGRIAVEAIDKVLLASMNVDINKVKNAAKGKTSGVLTGFERVLNERKLYRAVSGHYKYNGILPRGLYTTIDCLTFEICVRNHLLWNAHQKSPFMSWTPSLKKTEEFARRLAARGENDVKILKVNFDKLPDDTLIWSAAEMADTFDIGEMPYYKHDWLLSATAIIPDELITSLDYNIPAQDKDVHSELAIQPVPEITTEDGDLVDQGTAEKKQAEKVAA